MNVKDHYANHLAPIYSWMVGDLKAAVEQQKKFFYERGILPKNSGVAVDLGAGHGVQSLALAEAGFHVHALDFDELLVAELRKNSFGMSISVIREDIRNLEPYYKLQAELVVCCGDTLTHLHSMEEVKQLIWHCYQTLQPQGILVLIFRDYTRPLTGDARFIPVKSDEHRIFTCVLDYSTTHVTVTDLLMEKIDSGWQQKVSSYQKVIINPNELATYLEQIGFKIIKSEAVKGMYSLIAEKTR